SPRVRRRWSARPLGGLRPCRIAASAAGRFARGYTYRVAETHTAREHPYIVRTPGTCGGRARIDGTRIAVWLLVGAILRDGSSPEEFVADYPHLNLAQVHDALSFYYDHRSEIDRDLREQEAAWPRKKPRKSR